mmetsp:Transcript_1262/g.2649  ORF Transcript_1262/g.2649 Transcript_1262/m.2649 type:complete len:194 (-) Transcript_1262:291-872(-)
MLNLLQCQGFNPWSMNYQFDWVDKGSMKYVCDNIETQDLLKFQQFTSLIPVVQRTSISGTVKAIPEVTKTGVPLSTIIVAHHNLVTYGVPFETWTNPGPEKRYYSPAEAIPALANSTLFRDGGNNTVVDQWLAGADLEPEAVKDVPGMSRWVRLAKACFAIQEETPACAEKVGSNFWKNWFVFHPNTEITGSD